MLRKFALLALLLGVVVGLARLGWEFAHRRWDGETRLTIIFISDKVAIESIDPVSKTGVTLKLPANLLVASVAGRGTWSIAGITQAGSKRWVADSLAGFLGVSYDSLDQDMNFWDRWRYSLLKRKVVWHNLDPLDQHLVEEKRQPDGVSAYVLDPRWELVAKTQFSDTKVLSEGFSLKIINSTSTPGMGNYASRMIENRGVRVATVDSNEEAVDNCELVGDANLKKTATAKFLLNWFGCAWQPQPVSDSKEMTLVLGKKFRVWWRGE